MTDDEPITLAEACQLFPRAKLTISTLRAEAARGHLDIFRIGKRDYTTPKAMREMVMRCHEDDPRRACISTRSANNGLSVTERVSSVRTGCGESDRAKAEKALADYIGDKYKPVPSDQPLIVDVLNAYLKEVIPHKKTGRNLAYRVSYLLPWWGEKTTADITTKSCRAYAETKSAASAASDLKVLKSAVAHWHREHGPLTAMPIFWRPRDSPPKDRWLTRSEAARLLWAARRSSHLRRCILLHSIPGHVLA